MAAQACDAVRLRDGRIVHEGLAPADLGLHHRFGEESFVPFDRGEHGLDRGPLLLELRAPLAHALLSGRNGFLKRCNLGLERLLRSAASSRPAPARRPDAPHGIDGRLRISRLDPRPLIDSSVYVVKRGGVRSRSGKNAGSNDCGKNGPLENTGDHHFASFTASPRSDSATSIRSAQRRPKRSSRLRRAWRHPFRRARASRPRSRCELGARPRRPLREEACRCAGRRRARPSR